MNKKSITVVFAVDEEKRKDWLTAHAIGNYDSHGAIVVGCALGNALDELEMADLELDDED